MNGLAASRPCGDDLLRRRRGAPGDELDGAHGGLGLDHHDGDVVTGDAARDDHVEHGLLELVVGREGDPLAADEGDAHAADRAAEGQAGQLGRGRCGVDRDDVVQVVGLSAMTVMTTWTSLRRPFLKVGRSGRSMRRQVRMASSDGRPSRRKNEPGIRPRAYMRSSTSTVRGKKSNWSLGCLPAVVADRSIVSLVEVGGDGAGGLAGQPAGLERDGARAERPVVDDGFCAVKSGDPPRVPPVLLTGAHT